MTIGLTIVARIVGAFIPSWQTGLWFFEIVLAVLTAIFTNMVERLNRFLRIICFALIFLHGVLCVWHVLHPKVHQPPAHGWLSRVANHPDAARVQRWRKGCRHYSRFASASEAARSSGSCGAAQTVLAAGSDKNPGLAGTGSGTYLCTTIAVIHHQFSCWSLDRYSCKVVYYIYTQCTLHSIDPQISNNNSTWQNAEIDCL